MVFLGPNYAKIYGISISSISILPILILLTNPFQIGCVLSYTVLSTTETKRYGIKRNTSENSLHRPENYVERNFSNTISWNKDKPNGNEMPKSSQNYGLESSNP